MTSRRETIVPDPEYLDEPGLPWVTVPSCLSECGFLSGLLLFLRLPFRRIEDPRCDGHHVVWWVDVRSTPGPAR